jgi:hypothetical protein
MRAPGQQREALRVDELARLGGERRAQHQPLCARQQLVDRARRVHFVDRVGGLLRTAAHADDAHGECLGKPRELGADAAHAVHHHGLPGQIRWRQMQAHRVPAVFGLRLEPVRKSARQHQHAGQRGLRNRLRGGAGGGGDAHAALQHLGVNRVIDADIKHMQPFDVRPFAHRRKKLPRMRRVKVLRIKRDLAARDVGVGQPRVLVGRECHDLVRQLQARDMGGEFGAVFNVAAVRNDQGRFG